MKPAILGDKFVYVTGGSLDDRPESAPDGSIFQDDSTGYQYWHLGGEWRLANFEGLSTDIKPTNVPINAWFHETDTDKHYQFDGTNWNYIEVSNEPPPEGM